MEMNEIVGALWCKIWHCVERKKNVMYHGHGVLVSLLSALIMNKNMEAKTSRLPIDKKLIRYE